MNEALHEQREWLRVTLSSIGDGVITCDTKGDVTFLNPVAQALTGWTQDDAAGKPLTVVFNIINEESRRTVENPATRALREGMIVGLANHTLLISTDGTERPIDDCAAPTRNAKGEVAGVVLVFRDITERKQQEKLVQDTLAYAQNIIATLREPFLVINGSLKVHTANRSFYENFHTTPEETQGRLVYDLGNGQWDIPGLRAVLQEVLSNHHPVVDYEVEHDFPTIGRRFMLLNAARIRKPGNHSNLILLAIEDITERKRAEAAARESEERYRILFNSMDEGYCIIEMIFDERQKPVDYRFLEVNGAFQKQAGMPDVTGKRMLEFVSDIEEHWLANYGAVALTGEPIRFANEYKGLGSWFDVYAFRVGEPDSRRVAVLFNNITERKRAEAAVRESEERYRTLVEQVKDYAIFATDPRGRATTWNEGVKRVLGFTEAEFIGQDIVPAIFTPEDVRDGVAQQELDDAAAHGSASNDRWMRRKDGTRFFAAGITTALHDGDGTDRLVGFTKVMRDQTERKQLEVAVRDSEIRYRRLFESAKDGILILDFASGKIIDANPFMSELLGYSRAELLGKELWQIGLFRDKSESEAAVRELQEKGYIRYEDLPLETVHGRKVEVEIVANAYREDDHPVIQCNIRDITERARLERQAKEQAAELADLHRRKDEFLAMLSHELRNPLAPISNAVQLLRLQRGGENPIEQQARNIIERQVGQLKHLVDDLLEISRITAGRIHLRPERVTVGGIVERAVETVHPLLEQHRHDLTVSLPPQAIWLNGDAARLEQVMVNLLTNAAKYTADGGRIWLDVEQQDHTAVVRVRDTGVGIAPNLLPRIFDLFTQAERSLDRAQGGLGIGLSLVQRLVELHDGTVEVSSTLGRGSEFIVRLPATTTFTPPPILASETIRSDGSLRVLVVDDSVDSAQTLALLLQASGHDVRVAHDGPSGLEAARAYQPDVAFLDIGLPKLSGYEVAQRIRQQPALKDIVLTAMTGYGQESDRQRSREAGFDHHLVKPTDFAEVRQILAAVVAKAK